MEIAIVGIGCRLPGCGDAAAFWQLLLDGTDGLTRFNREEMLADGVPADLLARPDYVPVAGYLPDGECFDAGYFGISAAEARSLDPQQRLLLECAVHALEDAGHAPARVPGPVSVFAGVGANGHFWRTLEAAEGDPGRQFLAYLANDKDFAATRIAYRLGLSGVALDVQTACSTSLVAVHLACQSLLLGESDLALAGAASLRPQRRAGYLHVPDGIESPDGVCRPFDRAAGGTVFSDGVAMLALRRLDEAVAAGDRIYAVIRGTAVNNDGADKLGFTAPSEAGQTAVVAEALAVAGVAPEDLAFVETHGTGTALGDAVELRALKAAFGGAAGRCALGAVKANIGHTDTVAGAAGLIKAALALRHGVLSPQANFTAPDPELGLETGPFFVNREALPLRRGGRPALAGVSSFGIGGSNAHVILEAPPQPTRRPEAARPQLLCVTAADAPALDRRLEGLRRQVAARQADPADLAFTLRRLAGDLPQRAAQVVPAGGAPFAETGRLWRGAARQDSPEVGFLLPGQGAQYPAMGRGLYDCFAGYRAILDEAAEVLGNTLGRDLRALLFEGTPEELAQTAVTQPLVFACDVAAGRLLTDFGLRPGVLLGHSLGEYAAACLAGVFDFAEGLRLVARRGALMQALPGGRMLMAAAGPETLRALLPEGAEIAALNAPESTVLSGPAEAIAAAEAALEAAGIGTQPLATSHAYHSAAMEPMLPDFRAALAEVELRAPQIQLISNLTGRPMTAAEAQDPETWCRQLRAPVRFLEGAGALLSRGELLLEAGPGRTLSSLVRQHPHAPEALQALATFRHPQDRRDDLEIWLEALAGAWTAGADLDWTPLEALHEGRVVDLPPYPFARDLHVLERPQERRIEQRRPTGSTGPELLVPGWRRRQARPADGRLDGLWLVEDGGDGTAAAVTAALQARGARTAPWSPEAVSADMPGDLRGLVLTRSDAEVPARLSAVARLLETREAGAPQPTVAWLARGLFDVTGTEQLAPEAHAGLGAWRCLPLEAPGLRCLLAEADEPDRAAEMLAADLSDPASPPQLAYRAGRRWVPDFGRLEERTAAEPLSGAVLVTGGRGTVGQLAVEALAGLAGPDGLDLYLLSRGGGDVPASGARVRVHSLQGDVGDPVALREAVATILAAHGTLSGVVHAAGTLAPAGFAPLGGDLAAAQAVHAPSKIAGTTALAAALEGTEVGFCLLVSSLSTWLGGIGYGAYAAANAYLDGVAQAQAASGKPWLSVAFDAFATGAGARGGPEAAAAFDKDRGRAVLAEALQAARGGLAGVALASADAFAPRWQQWGEAAQGRGAMSGAPVRSDAAEAPGSPAETAERAWREVLGLERCDPHANFFALGGSSLLALQVLSRLRRDCGLDIPLAQFLAEPTLAGLTAGLPTVEADEEDEAETRPLADRSRPLPVLPGQRRLWIAEAMAGARPAFAVTAAYRIEGPLEADALAAALAALSERHEPLRTRFLEEAGEPHQQIDPPGQAPALERLKVPQGKDGADDVEACAEAFFARPFDLTAGPLWRAGLAPLADGAHLLLLAIHHIVVDDWSVGLLLEDLGALYARAAAGDALETAPRRPQFADICQWRSAAPTRADEVAYWRDQLAGLPEAPPIPYDGAAEEAAGSDPYAGGLLRLRFGPDTTARLRAAAAACGTTPFVWLLACLKATLHGFGGARDLAVGTPLAGRHEAGTQDMVGYFVNPAVVRTRAPAEVRFADLLEAVRQRVLEAHAQGHTPFETLLGTLGLEGPGQRPFHVWFTLLTHAQPRRLGDGLAVQPLYLERRPARFPLALIVEPEGEGLIGHLEYAAAAYRPETAARLAEGLARILERTLADPETPLAELAALCARLRSEAAAEEAQRFAGRQRGRLAELRRKRTGTGGGES